MSSFKIPIGPQHPLLKEPENFIFTLDGELVVGVDARIGYMHKGVEKLMESKNYIQNIPLVERICGICNVAHTLCYCQNVEYLYDKEIPRRAEYIRVIVEELNRIHSHLLWLGLAAHFSGYDTLFMLIWRDREVVMDLIEELTGNRVSTAHNTIGGVRRDISKEQEKQLRKGMVILRKRTKYYKDISAREPSLVMRLDGVGMLSPKESVELCAVGPTARASGVKVDLRADDPYAAHDEVPFNVITYDTCDVLGRFLVRADETVESIDMVEYCLDHMPKGPIRIRLSNTPPRGEAVSRVEAPRGEDIHYVKSNGTDKPERYKVRAPTLGNLAALVSMLTTRGSYEVQVADLALILAGIDPCMCCMDRSVRFVDSKKGREWTWTWDQLKAYSNKIKGKKVR